MSNKKIICEQVIDLIVDVDNKQTRAHKGTLGIATYSIKWTSERDKASLRQMKMDSVPKGYFLYYR